jgi:hypothetical protein
MPVGPAYTKGTLRTAVLQQADAVGSDRWDATAGGEVDQIISDCFDREWKNILNANQYYTYAQVLVNTDAVTGRVPFASLSTGTGDTLQRLYRIIAVIGPTDNIVYNPATFREIPLGETFAANVRVFYREGDKIFILPKQLNTPFDFRVNWIPARPGDLSTDNIAINFPNEYQNILRWEASAWMLTKGGAETPASAELRQFAQVLRDDLLNDVARFSTDQDQLSYPDSRFEWGGS